MTDQPEPAVVAEGDLPHLRELRSQLLARGIESQIVRPPPEHCSS